jgi:hypothetical protein
MNDRAVLIGAGVLAAVLVSLGALWVLRDYAFPVFVNGNVIARQVDLRVGDMIAARNPAVRVGAARCPRLLDLTGRRSARCAIPIAGDELAVDVAMRSDRRDLEVHEIDALFVRRTGERSIAEDLEQQHGEPFTVQCPGAAVRVLHAPPFVTCEIEAPDLSRREVSLPFVHGGNLAVAGAGDLMSREARVLGAAVAGRREGSVTIPGSALERYLRGSAGFLNHGEVARRGLLGAARCPSRIVLHEGTHVRCTVVIADVTLAYDVHFEKGLGLRTDPSSSVAVIAPLREFAARYFARGSAGGRTSHVDVNCGTVPVIVMEPGSTLRCVGDDGAGSFYFTFRFTDAQGGFTIEAAPP